MPLAIFKTQMDEGKKASGVEYYVLANRLLEPMLRTASGSHVTESCSLMGAHITRVFLVTQTTPER
jgi:hypothetical protein